ncbi:hypothetical protein CWS01_16280 [Niallia nealsonii]|uniref:NADP-dependent oxidoreductase domain-containing protein n=1 Tax=Niallia nealsonii TaxID=115979 RepID=A0A2N0YZL6_9BACI|nr:hypothetical protein CWS01_16280 [Niallia nealsonii]
MKAHFTNRIYKEEKIGVIPWSPLAKGRLTRNWNESTARSENDDAGRAFYSTYAEADKLVIERVAKIAVDRGVPRAQVALAWVLQKEPVTAPIIGATKMSHLEDAVVALSVRLTPEEIGFLEEPYVPHPIVGFK